jgi:hypothetical protein
VEAIDSARMAGIQIERAEATHFYTKSVSEDPRIKVVSRSLVELWFADSGVKLESMVREPLLDSSSSRLRVVREASFVSSSTCWCSRFREVRG